MRLLPICLVAWAARSSSLRGSQDEENTTVSPELPEVSTTSSVNSEDPASFSPPLEISDPGADSGTEKISETDSTTTRAPEEEFEGSTSATTSPTSGEVRGFVSKDEEPISYRVWEPKEQSPNAVVYIIHGMAEHSGRYGPFAEELVQELGVRVISPDQRGHGLTSTHGGTMQHRLGEFRKGANAEHPNAITLMGSDVNDLILATREDLPVIIFGHSMGSVVAREALRIADATFGSFVKGLALSGVPTGPHWIESYPLNLIANIVKRTGLGHAIVQRTFTKVKFDDPVRRRAKNKELPNNCFISSDLAECEIFNNDPYTNHLVDAEILFSIVTTLASLETAKYFGPPSVDVLFITGREDPVAAFGDTARADADRMIKAGHQVSEIYLSGSRHEFLREREPIRSDGVSHVIGWMRNKLKQRL
jgi:alpha-beta hydrolase superfamily lysophospholipase